MQQLYAKHDRQVYRDYKNMSKSILLDIKKHLNKRIKDALKNGETVNSHMQLARARREVINILKNRS